MARCVARVKAGLPVLDEFFLKPQNKRLINKPIQVLNTLHTHQKDRSSKCDVRDPHHGYLRPVHETTKTHLNKQA